MKKIFLLFTVTLFITGCNRNNGDSGNEHMHEEHVTGETVHLNNGERWVANAETTQGIQAMKELIEEYMDGKITRDKLHKNLVNEYQTVFDKCTMTGEAHKQLHNYLAPQGDLQTRLKECDKTESCLEVVHEMEIHLKKYEKYFQ